MCNACTLVMIGVPMDTMPPWQCIRRGKWAWVPFGVHSDELGWQELSPMLGFPGGVPAGGVVGVSLLGWSVSGSGVAASWQWS